MSIVLGDDLVLLDGTSSAHVPLNHARICYQTWTRGITPTVSGTAPGFYAGALGNSLTNEFFRPTTSPATISYDFGESKFVDYVAIGAHTLGDTSSTVLIEHSEDDVTYTALPDFIANDNRAMIVLFSQIQVRYLRITLSYDGAAPVIGIIYAGIALAMQRPIYGGHSPVTLSRNTDTYPQTSTSGQWLGRSIVNNGFRSSADFKNLTAAWYRAFFDPFVFSARRYPFFFAWNPMEFAQETALCWSNGNISPSNMGTRDLMQVSIDLNGYGVDI